MKKILFVGITSNVGGIESYIVNLFENINEEYKLFFPYVKDMAYESLLLENNGTIIYDSPYEKNNYIDTLMNWYRIFKSYQFDVIYLNNCDIVSLSILRLAKLAGVKTRIFHAHNSANTKGLSLIRKFTEKYNRMVVNKVATHLLACSENAGDFIFGKHPYKVITNGIDIEKFKFSNGIRNNKAEELGVAEKKTVLFVGRFTDIKNPRYAVDVAKELHKLDENYCALICGNGPLFDEVKQDIDGLGANDYIKLLGNRFDINELYSVADYLIMPSKFEGFPFVLVEAQCSGLKCICSTNVERNTNLTNTIEYLDLDLGADEWAKQINALAPNENRELFKDMIVEAGYDISKTVSYIENIIEGEKI